MGRVKELLFEEIEKDKIVDEEYLLYKFLEDQKIQEYEQLQNMIKQSDVSSFFQQ